MIGLSCQMVILTRSTLDQAFGFTITIFGNFKHDQNLFVSR